MVLHSIGRWVGALARRRGVALARRRGGSPERRTGVALARRLVGAGKRGQELENG